jgi:hypothetical protein
MTEMSILLASHQRTTIKYPATPHITCPHTSPLVVKAIIAAPAAAIIRNAEVKSNLMLIGKLAPFYTALVFIQAIPIITDNRYAHEPTQKATSTFVLSSPFNFTKAKIPIIVIQIVKIMNAKITLS